MADEKSETKPAASKGGATAQVVDFLGEPAPKEPDDLRPDESGGELPPEEAKAARQAKKAESIAATGGGYPDTPSGRALAAVGDLDGEDAESSEQAREHGLAYQREKRKWRWGY